VTASLSGLLISLFFKILAPELLDIKLTRVWETFLGVGIPVFIMLVAELINKPILGQWRVTPTSDTTSEKLAPAMAHSESQEQNIFGVRVIAVSVGIVGTGIFILGLFARQGTVATIIGGLIALGFLPIWRSSNRFQKVSNDQNYNI
jgi:hypothetical protein